MPSDDEPAGGGTSTARRPRAAILVPAALAAMYVAQCVWFVGTQSLTYDEPTHVATGLDAWRYGRYERWNDQPPLARLLLVMPLLGGEWSVEPRTQPLPGAFWTFAIQPSAEALAWRTRLINVALGVTLSVLLWTAARGMFSEAGANLAVALFAFSPPLVAHFSVATVDGAAALLFFATVMMLLRWRRNPSWPATIAMGTMIGAFLIAKFSAPPMVLLTLAIMAGGSSIGLPLLDRMARAVGALAIALLIVWGAYRFHVGPLSIHSGSLTGAYAAPGAIVLPTARPVNVTVSTPAPEYLAGLGLVAQHAARGQPSILLGRVRKTGGWRAYYPFVAVVKWPIVVWLTALAVVILIAIGAVPQPPDFFVAMAFPIVYFALAIASNLDIGDRYILPVYPFLLLLCAGIWRAAARRRWATAAIVVAVAVHAIDGVRCAPDYLSYFNVFVRSDRPYEVLSDSNFDWGQGLIALRRYEHTHPGERTWLAYFGGVDPREYGVRAQPFGERDHPAGTVVISATHLSGQYLDDPSAYRWAWRHPLKAILNHTLYVFDVRE